MGILQRRNSSHQVLSPPQFNLGMSDFVSRINWGPAVPSIKFGLSRSPD